MNAIANSVSAFQSSASFGKACEEFCDVGGLPAALLSVYAVEMISRA